MSSMAWLIRGLYGAIFVLPFLVVDGAAQDQALHTSPSGHYITYGDETLMLIGESGTQCVPQNANLDYRAWIDDCHARGIRMVHLWSFAPVRQKQDGSEIEDRWGYGYPGLTPWVRHGSGPLAADQRPRWDLQRFDDGPDDALNHYWPRMRDLCRYAKERHMLVGITVFTGWANHDSDWVYHPLNKANGGPLTRVRDAVRIESPGTEVWEQPWDDAWPDARKTQWVWERLAAEFLRQMNGFGNVFFVFLDEHSYDEGNMGDHFATFFRKRGAVYVDWNARRNDVNWVYADTFGGADKNWAATKGFAIEPARPYLFLEGEPYRGAGVRTAIWTFAMGGGHYTFHSDERQETPRTGIMGYDPNVPGGDKAMEKRDWLGHASRFFNEHLRNLDALAPHNEFVGNGAYCLADPGREYAIYGVGSKAIEIDLRATPDTLFTARIYNPRQGMFVDEWRIAGGKEAVLNLENTEDWVIHLIAD